MQFWRRIPIHVDKEFLIFGGDVFRGFSCNLYDENVDGKLAQRSLRARFSHLFRADWHLSLLENLVVWRVRKTCITAS